MKSGMRRTIRRRRYEAKTDYKSRFTLLKSGKPRLVIRKTNRYVIAQVVVSEVAQDKVISGLTSKALIEKGWPKEKEGSLKNMAAAYLTGFLLAKKIKDKVDEVIVDFGMNRNVKKSRIYAVVRGAIDGGLKMNVGENILPEIKELKIDDKIKPVFDKLVKEK